MRSGVREGRSRVERKASEYKQQGMEQADAALEEARAYGDALEGEDRAEPVLQPFSWRSGSASSSA